MPPRILLFDAVGTLLHPESSVAAVYAAAGARHGSRFNEAEVEARFRAAFAAEEALDAASSGLRTDETRELRRWRSIVERIFIDVPAERIESLFRDLWNHFARPTSWRLFADVGPALASLSARGALIAVASNFDARLYDIVAALLPTIPRERVFVSSVLGRRKPAPEFFAACMEQLPNGAAGEVVLVGDDPENDFRGAQACGLQAVLLDRRERYSDIAPRMRTLAELL